MAAREVGREGREGEGRKVRRRPPVAAGAIEVSSFPHGDYI